MENYDNLRDITVFLHAHRNGSLYAWHNDAPGHDNVLTLKALQLNYVLKEGYVNLRCRTKPGCPVPIQPFRDPPGDPSNPETVVEQNLPEAWNYMFPGVPVPHAIGVACCAQFAVSKQQIRARPREEYERIFQWLMETTLSDWYSGRIMEYLWHIIFGQGVQQ